MTPLQLKYFVEIAKVRNITVAAAKLHVSQPSLSHHMALLEEELGARLLVRQPRGVSITEEGLRLLERATDILAQFERLKDDVSARSVSPRGLVRVCLADAIAGSVAIDLYRELASRCPDVRLELNTAMSSDARRIVESRQVDIALMPNTYEIPGLRYEPVFSERFCLFAHRRTLGRTLDRIDAASAFTLPLTAPSRDYDLRRFLERTAASHGVQIKVTHEINSADVSRALVRRGMAFGVWPRHSWPDVQLDPEVQVVPIEPPITRTLSIVWFEGAPATPAALAVRDVLRLVASRLEP